MPKRDVGAITWMDLTVPDAKKLRDFYKGVVGWKAEGLDCGGYDDYCMQEPKSGKTVAGVCHARGANRDLPSQWLIYINVADIAKSVKRCRALGGKVLHGPRDLMGGRFTVIRDPAGAVAALYQQPRCSK